jgi:8-oxo-dGTP pyrophosphatase MutT (NUDIX family)
VTSALPRDRRAARLIILDDANAVLLVRYGEFRTNRPPWYWSSPGGGIDAGETPQQAAARELLEETGLSAPIGPLLWEGTVEFETEKGPIRQHESFFLVRAPGTAPAVHNSTPEPIEELRWWTLPELRSTSETIYPDALLEQLQRLIPA